jgi:hypothetical protein
MPAVIRAINWDIWTSTNHAPPTKNQSWSGIEMMSLALGPTELKTRTLRKTLWRGPSDLDQLIHHCQHDIFTAIVTYEDVFGWTHAAKFRFYFEVSNPSTPYLVPIADSYPFDG